MCMISSGIQLFDELTVQQQSTQELVMWCTLSGRLVLMDYTHQNAVFIPIIEDRKPDFGVLTKFFLQLEATCLRIRMIEHFSGYCREHISQYVEVLSESNQIAPPQPSRSLEKCVCALEPIPFPKQLKNSSPAATQVKRARVEKGKAKKPETAVLEPDTTLDMLLRQLGDSPLMRLKVSWRHVHVVDFTTFQVLCNSTS
ncbi:hypothetical protein BDQ17DRAFT_1329264 [Cyathus striatus]|nr:hypothetical protein BDQ17DRAFT_1329264 [Cyathus striatus]